MTGGLHEVSVDTQSPRPITVSLIAGGCERDDRQVLPAGIVPHPLQYLEAVLTRDLEIEDQMRWQGMFGPILEAICPGQVRDRFLAVAQHAKGPRGSRLVERALQEEHVILVVLDEQDPGGIRGSGHKDCAGSSMKNRLPIPAREITPISAPMRSRAFFARASPIPVPPGSPPPQRSKTRNSFR